MSERRILDRNWPWQALAMLLLVLLLGGLKFIMTGFNDDFGMGFALGLLAGGFIALLAAGWRRGEMR